MTKTEIKDMAKEMVMHSVSTALIRFQEGTNIAPHVKIEVEREIIKQANRVAKIMGYEEAWHE